MATLLLSAAGAALGGAVGGSFAGMSSLVLGKAIGATLGSVIDQRLLGAGSAPVETGRVERFRVMGSSEGAALARVFGRTRVAGQIIWSSRFLEHVNEEEVGGKGGNGGATVREFSYTVSLAVALCEGEVLRVGRIWADGQALDQSGLNWRLHPGGEDQLPDPLIAAIEGAERAPAYRGTAYVVFENLSLTPYGNRIPQFNFEVYRRPAPVPGVPGSPALDMRGVALVPGTGEYALATEPVYLRRGKGEGAVLNVHNDLGVPDLKASLGQLAAELPNVGSVSLVVSWFGDDLRCDRCRLRPMVEQAAEDGSMPWVVSGLARAAAPEVSRVDGRPVFGGTPADAAVLQAIAHVKASGRAVMFYPFILMDVMAGNGLGDPWTGAADQPAVPWRGRITLAEAPGRPGSSDKSAAAAAEVAAFFGTAAAADFEVLGGTVAYHGPAEWSYRRFILHYAHLCALAGGVDAFCIGSEMRGLTQIRDSADGYPAVQALMALAAEVRSVLGPATRIGYAADWSEYFGHHPADGSEDVLYHLDPLWAHPAIDFVGIDNYMPLSDWRDGSGHADEAAGAIYDLAYLKGNVAGGEGYNWYYADAAGREAQERLPVTDGAYGEPWVFRYKDLVNWWSRPHFNRLGGVKGGATAWVPKSKPIWFTELGCPAVDKGTNQPNVFHDPKSSESFFPYFSSGARDDFIQYRYLQAMFAHWSDPANNPESDIYAGRMVDMGRAHVWAWDARPWPDFPNRIETWVDGANYHRGHWLNGRASIAALGEVVAEICARADMREIDVTGLHGAVTGYAVEAVETARQSLQPLMLAYGFDSFALDGKLAFANRNGRVVAEVSPEGCAVVGKEPVVALTRAPAAETAARVTVGFVRADMDYVPGAVEAVAPDQAEPNAAQTAVSIVFSEGEARAVAERWLSEGRVARDGAAFALPPSSLAVTAGDIVALGADLYRVDRVEEAGHRAISAVRIEPGIYAAPIFEAPVNRAPVIAAPTPVNVEFLDLPLLTGDEVPHTPHVAVARTPWAGPVAVYSANADFGYALNCQLLRPAVFGETLEALPRATPGLWMRVSLRVRIASGSLQSRSEADVLNGANAAALRGGTGDWEVIQFRDAVLVAPREYELTGLLRGQAGTDGVMPDVWPAGTDFVLLDGSARQVSMPASARGLERHYRVGPAVRAYDDPSYVHVVEAFAGVGLRPYRPTHFRAVRRADGGIALMWTRRTRIDGDSWQGSEVPLGEEREAYLVRVLGGGSLLREVSVGVPQHVYTAAEQVADGAPAALVFEVAQVSDRFGSGPFERIEFDG
jgi:GTA TIM-barrel-like domain/Putative phage tail protein